MSDKKITLFLLSNQPPNPPTRHDGLKMVVYNMMCWAG